METFPSELQYFSLNMAPFDALTGPNISSYSRALMTKVLMMFSRNLSEEHRLQPT